MALMDEFKEERKAVFENGTLKQKALYIWDYYKWHIIIPIAVVSFIVWYIVHIITAPDKLFEGVLLNAYGTETSALTEDMINDYYEEKKINPKDLEASLNTSIYYTVGEYNYETIQCLMSWRAAGVLDFLVGDVTSISDLAYKGYFIDLRDVLTSEQLEQLEPYFLYMDQDTFTLREETLNNNGDVSTIEYPDCTKPEEMNDPVPIMIDVSQCELLSEIYSENTFSDTLALAIGDEDQVDAVVEFLEYLMR